MSRSTPLLRLGVPTCPACTVSACIAYLAVDIDVVESSVGREEVSRRESGNVVEEKKREGGRSKEWKRRWLRVQSCDQRSTVETLYKGLLSSYP
eukprot:405718-Rhodomonas_salina.3